MPAGKRLVVETVSANAAMPTGQKATVNVATVGGGQNGRAWLALAEQGNVSGLDRYTVAQALRMYADPLTAVAFQVVRSGAASTATFNLSVAAARQPNLQHQERVRLVVNDKNPQPV